jgi:tight adherence protein B
MALAGSVAIGAIVGSWLAGPVGGAAGAIFGAAVVRGGRRRGAGRLRAHAEQQLQEYMQTLAACVRAGLSVRRALDEAARDVDPPLRPALDASMRALAIGEPIERALDRLVSVTGEREASLLAALLSVHARSGGDLPALLDDVARIVGERIEGRRSIRAFTAQGRASGAVLAVLPVAFVALLSWSSGEGLGAFYATPLGSALLLAGLGCDALGFLWIRRIVEQPTRDR